VITIEHVEDIVDFIGGGEQPTQYHLTKNGKINLRLFSVWISKSCLTI